jgi:hypothetical protein
MGEHFEYLGRAFSHTGPTGGTFGIIYQGDTFVHDNALFRAVFHTQPAFDTPDLAGLFHHRLDGIPVGTERHGPIPIRGNLPEDLLRTFCDTAFTTGTFSAINTG